MTDTVQARPPSTNPDEEIDVLRPENVRSLQIPWDARYTRDEIEKLAGQGPGLCLWNKRTGGYLLGGNWRHRHEIANVIDINGPSVAIELLRAFLARASQLGILLAVVAEYAERRRQSFYAAADLKPIEEIIVYELRSARKAVAGATDRDGLTAEQIDLKDLQQRRELLRLDHSAFPWLWWNSPGEFDNYASVPGVSIKIVRAADGQIIGYIGTTSLGSWGHLDRIAVDPNLQGRGFGRKLLDMSIRELSEAGAKRIALSTQASNTVSRALYESTGFRRARPHDYLIYGRRLDEAGDTSNEITNL